MRRTIGCFAISGCVGLCFTWVAVLGEVGVGSQEPAPPAAKEKKAAGKALRCGAAPKVPFRGGGARSRQSRRRGRHSRAETGACQTRFACEPALSPPRRIEHR